MEFALTPASAAASTPLRRPAVAAGRRAAWVSALVIGGFMAVAALLLLGARPAAAAPGDPVTDLVAATAGPVQGVAPAPADPVSSGPAPIVPTASTTPSRAPAPSSLPAPAAATVRGVGATVSSLTAGAPPSELGGALRGVTPSLASSPGGPGAGRAPVPAGGAGAVPAPAASGTTGPVTGAPAGAGTGPGTPGRPAPAATAPGAPAPGTSGTPVPGSPPPFSPSSPPLVPAPGTGAGEGFAPAHGGGSPALVLTPGSLLPTVPVGGPVGDTDRVPSVVLDLRFVPPG
ncbi:MAG TPA: hypothetical protein VMB72_00395 [Acidimicrobiales bacterium]|nr:hypothetical protein [Acidimicrobiales bacterium]